MLTDLQIEMWKRDFEAKGPAKVTEDLARQLYGERSSQEVRLAEAFLKECEAEEERSFREGESDRSNKTLALAEDANKIAKDANRWSMVAAGIALVAVIVAIVALLT